MRNIPNLGRHPKVGELGRDLEVGATSGAQVQRRRSISTASGQELCAGGERDRGEKSLLLASDEGAVEDEPPASPAGGAWSRRDALLLGHGERQ